LSDGIEVSPDGQSSTYNYGSHSTPTLDEFVDKAIARMADQPEPLKAAAILLQRWFEAGTLPSTVLPDLIFDYLNDRVAARAEKSTTPIHRSKSRGR
jgi:hypothetical protein